MGLDGAEVEDEGLETLERGEGPEEIDVDRSFTDGEMQNLREEREGCETGQVDWHGEREGAEAGRVSSVCLEQGLDVLVT